MKILLLLILFFMTGCDKTLLNLKTIKSIRYNNTIINKEDYKEIIDKLNNIDFSTEKLFVDFNKTIIIEDKNKTHIFNISNNGIRYKIDNKEYYSTDTNLTETIKEISKNYKTTDYFNINYSKECYPEKDDLFIKLSDSNNYYIIYLTEEIKDFSILSNTNNLEQVFEQVDYKKETINNKKIIIQSEENIKILFTSNNGIHTTITPLKNNNQIIFKTSYN